MSETRGTPPAPGVGRVANALAVASGKGGVGKTSIAVNLAVALASSLPGVALLDADIGLANADLLCGLSPARRLDRALTGPEPVDAWRLALEAPGGFSLIPGASGGSLGAVGRGPLTDIARARLAAAVASLAAGSDAVIADTMAGIGPEVRAVAHACGTLLVVTTPEPTAITDAYQLVRAFAADTRDADADADPAPSRPRVALVVNRVGSPKEAATVAARFIRAADAFLGVPVVPLGGVREDRAVSDAVRQRLPLLLWRPRSRAARDIRAVAMRLDGLIRTSTACTPRAERRPAPRRAASPETGAARRTPAAKASILAAARPGAMP